MTKTLWFIPTLLAMPTLSMAENTSPWLPIPGEASITLNYTQQQGDDAYIGDQKISASDITGGAASSFDRNDAAVLFSYGISDNLALDALIGYGEVEAGSADQDSGFTDSTIGLSWRVIDEFATADNVPTITFRGAVIIKGDYDGDRLAALGKAENGLQASAIIGKQLNDQFGLSAVDDLPGLKELKGAGLLDGTVPDDFVVPSSHSLETLMDDEVPLEDEEEVTESDEF